MTDASQMESATFRQPFPLREFSAGLGQLQADANDDVCIKGISDDSRRIRPGYALICLPRSERHANEYALMAEAKGATAIISVGIAAINVNLPVLHLDTMQQAGLLLRRMFKTEKASSCLFGITGTDGKTSVAWMLREALTRYQRKPVWSCGTLGWMRSPDDVRDIGNTTPSMITMHALLSSACLEDVHSVICEISSHGIAQERIAGLDFKTAIWTSMGHDHLQDHGGYAGYLATKAKFICATARQGGQVIANADHDDIRSNAPSGTHWYGHGLYREDVDLSWEQELPGLLRLHSGDQEVVIENIPLGDFHAENAACVALALMTSAGITLPELPELLNDISAPPGRMQYLAAGPGQVFIDYAHTPEALERCMQAARKLTHHRLLLAFGCGGERDREKRPHMGAIAAKYADVVWVTSDNPRGELPAVIASEIEEGMSRPYQAEIHLQLDRELAIAEAIAELNEGDTLVIAGKGHEAYMEVSGIRTPWSDADIASKYLHENSFFAAGRSGGVAACA
jgi:UDP-N-acetylmuramoyl-L-alanyl-D-glutamate--2,6-diaminopimelate ligase